MVLPLQIQYLILSIAFTNIIYDIWNYSYKLTPTLWFCYRGEQSWNKMSNDFSKFSDNCRSMSLHQNAISQASWHLTCVTKRFWFAVQSAKYFISGIKGMVTWLSQITPYLHVHLSSVSPYISQIWKVSP